MIQQQHLPPEVTSKKFMMPTAYRRVFELGLTNLEPWHFLKDDEFRTIYAGIRGRFPQRLLVPFARRQDNDDVACFVVESPDIATGEVLVIHDYASPGSEVDIHLPSFWDWFRMAVDEMIETSNPVKA